MRRAYLAGPMSGYIEHNYPLFHFVAEALAIGGWDVVNPADNFKGQRDLPRTEYVRKDIGQLMTCNAIVLLPQYGESAGAMLELQVAYQMGLDIFEWDTEELRPVEMDGVEVRRAITDPTGILIPVGKPEDIAPEGHLKAEDFMASLTEHEPAQRCCIEHDPMLDTPSMNPSFSAETAALDAWVLEKLTADAPVEDGDPARLETILTEAQGLVYGDRQAAYSHPMGDFTAMGRISAAILGRWLESEGYLVIKRDVVVDGAQTEPLYFPDIPPRIATMLMQAVKLSREAANPKRDNRVDGAGYWLCTDRAITGE